MNVRTSALLVFSVILLTATGALAQGDIKTFSRGSLIIPMQANFQTDCGTASGYGLVWRILKSNEPGGYNENHPITIYWVINNQKQSPNRCRPSNKHVAPAPSTDSRWDDGCDIVITNNTEQPVVPVINTIGFPTSTGIYPYGAIYNRATATPAQYPAYAAQTLDNSGTGAARFTTVRYMGGPFVIDASDAQYAINFLQSSADTESDKFFKTPNNTGCSIAGTHEVKIHQATAEFQVTVAKRFNKVPPKLALLDSGGGVAGGILDNYLANAGLNFAGAGGCPQNSYNCTGAAGVIYDKLNANRDLISNDRFPYGLLNAKDASGKDRYKVFWAPHWVSANSTYAEYRSNGDGSADQEENSLKNIAHFADKKGHGVFAECASLESYEGSYDATGSLRVAPETPATQFHYTNTIITNGLTNGDSYDGRNCTDPNYVSGACVLYPYPADPLSQVGDFHYTSTGGHVHNYKPNFPKPSTYRAGLSRLAVSWDNWTSVQDWQNPSGDPDRGWDFFTSIQKDNDPNKATVVYLAGHDLSSSPAGNRWVLNTLMNLGADPVGRERSLSAPVAFDDNNGSVDGGTRALLIAGSYEAVEGLPPGSDMFQVATGSRWVFPSVPGHLRAHPILGAGALKTGENNIQDATLWDAADKMPAPGARNVFTYLGGEVRANAFADAGVVSPNDVAQVGWQVETVAASAIVAPSVTAPNSGCIDTLQYGRTPGKDGTDKLALVPGADGVCDLQQALQFTSVNVNNGADTSNIAALTGDVASTQAFLSRVRGYCWSTTSGMDGSGTPRTPASDTDCNDDEQTNAAVLGGIVWGTPAVIEPSPNISDNGARRPTVAYAGGWDGQLHAFYVSGGSGYTGPASTVSYRNPAASTKFATNYASLFAAGTPPAKGTELWSFLPATQLPWLRSNNARVDSSPVVQDVFADFTGTGVREWHTVLVFSIGATGREVAALDVSNPLRPVLLWDLVGSKYDVAGYPTVSPTIISNFRAGPSGLAQKWTDNNTNYFFPPDADPGRAASTLYDYTDMGGARALSVGQMRSGLEPVYAAFVATNSSTDYGAPNKGLELFAIDIVTGQKLWQWERQYTAGWTDNTVPPGATIAYGATGVEQVYVGDMEGRLWELNPQSGRNANLLTAGGTCTPSSPCKFPLFDTGSTGGDPQPFTTSIGLARIPKVVTAGTAFERFAGARVLMAGTGGTNWVGSGIDGRFHVLLLDSRFRKPVTAGGTLIDGSVVTAADAITSAQTSGIVQEPTPFPRRFTGGEHLFGNLTITGSTVFLSTAVGSVNDIHTLGARPGGGTYSFEFSNTATSGNFVGLFGNRSVASYGGVAAYSRNGTTTILTAEPTTIGVVPITAVTAVPNPALTPNSSTTGKVYQFLNMLQRYLP